MLETIALIVALVIIAVLWATAAYELLQARTAPTLIGLGLAAYSLAVAAFLIVEEIA